MIGKVTSHCPKISDGIRFGEVGDHLFRDSPLPTAKVFEIVSLRLLIKPQEYALDFAGFLQGTSSEEFSVHDHALEDCASEVVGAHQAIFQKLVGNFRQA